MSDDEDFTALSIEERRELASQAVRLFESAPFRLALLEARENLFRDWEATKAGDLGKREELHAELRGLRRVLTRLTALADERRVDPEGG